MLLFKTSRDNEEYDVLSDINYIRKSCALMTEFLQKGCDVTQMGNGDIMITETKVVNYIYKYDSKKRKMVRAQASGRSKKHKTENYDSEDNSNEAQTSRHEAEIEEIIA